MTKILVLSGRKQGGKTTCRNFLYGHVMKQYGCIDKYEIDDKGQLWVNVAYKENNQDMTGMGQMDVDRIDPDFMQFASSRIWPDIKSYSFADQLKTMAMTVFGLSYQQCYGTDADKNTLTDMKWSDLSFALPPRLVGSLKKSTKVQNPTTFSYSEEPPKFDQFVSGREFLQLFGTEVCRKIKGSCWVDACFRQIDAEKPKLAVITDARFPNEVQSSLDAGATVLRFTRGPFKGKDEHESETALDEWDTNLQLRSKFTIFCENDNMTIAEQNSFVLNELIRLGVLETQV